MVSMEVSQFFETSTLQGKGMDNTLLYVARRDRLHTLWSDLKPQMKKLLEECIEEHVGPICNWPIAQAEAILSTHLRYQDRLRLSNFLLHNRLPPVMMAHYYITRKMLKDEAARKHVASIILEHKTGKLAEKGVHAHLMGRTLPNGDSNPQKVCVIATPEFAFDTMYEHHWFDAIQMLKENCLAPKSTVPIAPHRQAESVWKTTTGVNGRIYLTKGPVICDTGFFTNEHHTPLRDD